MPEHLPQHISFIFISVSSIYFNSSWTASNSTWILESAWMPVIAGASKSMNASNCRKASNCVDLKIILDASHCLGQQKHGRQQMQER